MAYHAVHLRDLSPAVAGGLMHDSSALCRTVLSPLDLVPGWCVAQRWSKRRTRMALSVLCHGVPGHARHSINLAAHEQYMLHTNQVCFLIQVPGGWAAQRWGGRRTLMASFALWATACLLTPGTADNVAATAAARVAVGVAQGLLIPSIHTVLSQARAQERCAN